MAKKARKKMEEDAVPAFEFPPFDEAGFVWKEYELATATALAGVLALALGLSDLAGKNVRIDSLFIDEGFGTLDPESLDAAAGAIENLPTAGRMVGIITHIEELSGRLPGCIRVEKRASGSHIQIEVN